MDLNQPEVPTPKAPKPARKPRAKSVAQQVIKAELKAPESAWDEPAAVAPATPTRSAMNLRAAPQVTKRETSDIKQDNLSSPAQQGLPMPPAHVMTDIELAYWSGRRGDKMPMQEKSSVTVTARANELKAAEAAYKAPTTGLFARVNPLSDQEISDNYRQQRAAEAKMSVVAPAAPAAQIEV